MPRLTNPATRVVVNVDEDAAAKLGSEWVPADAEAQPKRKPGRPAKPKPTEE